MSTISISRRKFAQLLGAGAACAVAKPALSFATASSAQAAAPTVGVSNTSANLDRPNSPGDWPMYGHDVSRTNYNPDETIINAGNAGQLVQRWQMPIGSNGTPVSGLSPSSRPWPSRVGARSPRAVRPVYPAYQSVA